MFIEERHQAILNLIKENGRVTISEIQEKYNVSADSARRDLRILEDQGLLKRTYGGAIPIMQVGICPPRHRDPDKMVIYDNYAAIAKKGTELIKENDVVYLTSGSVGFLAVDYLPKDIKYTLVVNSPTLADKFKYWDNLTVYMVGGRMRMHGTTSIVDSFATSFVRNMHFDLSLMTAAGVESKFGVTNGTDETAEFQRTIIRNSRKNILLMPNQKVGFKAFIKVCNVDDFDILITDWDALEEELAKIEEKGVEVIVVKKE